MSIEKGAIEFVRGYLEKKSWRVENVAHNRQHPGYDFIAKKGKKRLKIEGKGCGRLWGIPDLYLYVVYFIGQEVSAGLQDSTSGNQIGVFHP